MKIVMTLGLLFENDRLLLGMKKRGFAAGKWNGFGGKVKPEETIEEAFIREYEEESMIKVLRYEKSGVLQFEFKDSPDLMEVHLFRILEYSGEPRETEEMRPQWFALSDVPFESMWADDKHWMPLFFNGKKIAGKFNFDGDTLLDFNLKEVDSI